VKAIVRRSRCRAPRDAGSRQVAGRSSFGVAPICLSCARKPARRLQFCSVAWAGTVRLSPSVSSCDHLRFSLCCFGHLERLVRRPCCLVRSELSLIVNGNRHGEANAARRPGHPSQASGCVSYRDGRCGSRTASNNIHKPWPWLISRSTPPERSRFAVGKGGERPSLKSSSTTSQPNQRKQ